VRGMDGNVFVRRQARTQALSLLGMIVSVWRWYRPRGAMPLSDIRDMIEEACVRDVKP
jgi:TetR/AcrR family transcriptional regulator, cholesterol catabolism regulator